jgi:hypothetical protein
MKRAAQAKLGRGTPETSEDRDGLGHPPLKSTVSRLSSAWSSAGYPRQCGCPTHRALCDEWASCIASNSRETQSPSRCVVCQAGGPAPPTGKHGGCPILRAICARRVGGRLLVARHCFHDARAENESFPRLTKTWGRRDVHRFPPPPERPGVLCRLALLPKISRPMHALST